jgi:hypothetical protein
VTLPDFYPVAGLGMLIVIVYTSRLFSRRLHWASRVWCMGGKGGLALLCSTGGFSHYSLGDQTTRGGEDGHVAQEQGSQLHA